MSCSCKRQMVVFARFHKGCHCAVIAVSLMHKFSEIRSLWQQQRPIPGLEGCQIPENCARGLPIIDVFEISTCRECVLVSEDAIPSSHAVTDNNRFN